MALANFGLGGLILAVSANLALAEASSQTLYSYKHWEVEFVTFDDGSVACLAEVDASTDSFTLWVYPDTSVRLQFYSTSWDFGDTGDTADLVVKIDRRANWTLNDAELYLNSVLFTLPDSNAAVNFLLEVAQGTRLYLSSDNGEQVMNYSLLGSKASMRALIDCGDKISGDGNPFN
jgi:hypothetical protein